MRLFRLCAVALAVAICPLPALADDVTYAIPLRDAPRRGPDGAKITLVEYADFQCPYCARAESTLKQLAEVYSGEIRFVFKQNPLPFHAHAELSAEAALAAGEQGKFWEMHDVLYQHSQELDRPFLDQYAKTLGLDMTRFDAALEDHRFRAAIDRDQDEAHLFDAGGTPTFFINGQRLVGAVPRKNFEKIIDQEMKRANAALASGTSRAELYESLVKSGKTKADPPSADSEAKHDQPQASTVAIGSSAQKGPAEARLTIVEFGDYQCPFSARVVPVIDRLLADYPNEIRFVFKHHPLPFHENAVPAALAAEAAQTQGKFWEFHALAFSHQKDLSPATLEAWAAQIGLDMAKYRAAVADPATKSRVDAEVKEALASGATGTPNFFFNGRFVRGVQPYEVFKKVAEEEIRKADVLLATGVSPAEIYEKAMAANVAAMPPLPPAQAAKPPRFVAVPIDGAASTGPANAKVTIVAFSDFQCPFCGRVVPTIQQLEKKYGNDLRVVFRHDPLPFHKNAPLAAEAALAAGEQGKFWEMHDLLFANQKALERPDLEGYAAQLHLDLARFRSALDTHRFQQQVKRDQALALAVGAKGTPTFYVNGQEVAGAIPFAQFDAIVATEKAHAEKLLSQGTPASGIYEAALRDSHAAAPTPPAPAQAAAKPDDDGPGE